VVGLGASGLVAGRTLPKRKPDMPKYTPADDEMDESYSSAPVEAPDQPAKSVDEQNEESAAVLIAKSELPSGTKVGDTCTFRVVNDFGDEVSLEYVSESKPESENEPETASMESQELTELAEKGA